MRKNILIHLFILACAMNTYAQAFFDEKPKIVVGIVVDQMRWDYLDRYYNRFTEDGFRRMISEGYSCNNCLINYLPTITSIGHTSAYTGSTPALHGICGNNFMINGEKVYCVTDKSMETVGSSSSKGKASPKNLLATTIGDQLRLHTDFRSKVIGVSYKDRAAILPAGHSANAAYWFDDKNACFVSSTYYMKELPKWAKNQNAIFGKNKEIKELGDRISKTPICGTIITDMAIAALEGEQLGKGEATDMLCVSYSQTDIIGHEWSTRGQHTDDAYIQLDKDLARLFAALDKQVGKGNYVAFLTADHGAAHNWKFMQENKLHGGPWLYEEGRENIEKAISKHFGKELKPVIAAIYDYRLFLNHNAIKEQGLNLQEVKQVIIDYLISSPNVNFAIDFQNVMNASIPPILRDRILMGYHPRRSGDIIFIPEPGYYEFSKLSSPVGTTHGEWNPYDAHIPLLFMGWKIPHGATSREVHITDIAPTICQLLHIQQPNACVGEAITEITK